MPKTQTRKSARTHSSPSSQRKKSAVTGEEWFRTTLYSIGDAVITTDAKGKILQMNPVAERLTGWSESEARGQTLSKVFHIVNEHTRKKVLNPVQRILREGIVIGLANHTILIARDGTEYPIADAGSPIKDSNGKIVGAVLVFRDQTAERKARRAVHDARDFAESIIATIREPLLILDNKLEVVSVNRSFLKTFQVTSEETIGRKLYDLGNRQWDIPKLRALLEDILPSNSHFDDFEVTHTFEHIGRRTMLLNARRLFREENRSQLILLAIEDITEKKQAEEELRQSEERFRRITNIITDYAYTFRVNPDMTLTGEWVSESFTKTFGYSLPEIDARGGWQSMVHPEDLPIMQQHALKVIGGAKDIVETRFIARDGTIRWIRDYATPVWDAKENRVVRIYGAAQDITERKQAEEALRKSEEWFRRLAETTSTAIFIYQEEKFVYVNRATEELSGYTRAELLTKRFWDVVHPDYQEMIRQRGLARQRGESVPNRYEFKIVCKDGTERWIDFTAGRIDWFGKPAAIGSAFDITERKRAEEALRANEQFLRQIMQLSPVIIYKITPESFIPTWVSENITTILGYSVEEALKPTWWQEHVHPDDRNRELRSAKQIMTTGHVLHEYRFFKKNGELIWVRDEMALLRDEQGKPLEILGAWTDITESKRKEEALYESEERYRRISDLVSDYAYAFRVQEDGTLVREWVTDSFTRITGYTPQEVDDRGGWSSIIYPDDMPIALERAKRLFAGQRDISEFRIVCKDGTIRWLRDHGYPEWDNTLGRIVRIYGAAEDITERKQAELAIKKNEARYRTIVENLNQAYYETDAKGRFTYYNPGLVFISGYTEEELLRTVSFHLIAEEHRRQIIRLYKQWFAEKRTMVTAEFKVQTKSGKKFWVEQITHFEFDFNGTLIKATNFLRDIDERKRAEEDLRRSREEYLQFFMEDITADYIATADGTVRQCNPAYVNIFGFSSMEEALATNIFSLYFIPQEREKFLSQLLQKRKLEYFELQMVKRDGTPLYFVANIIGKFDDEGKLEEIRGYLFDDTKRRQLEETLRQAQKLESIGTLASGIAHDFNNILGIILGHASLLERIHHEPEKFSQSLTAITTATKRGASLVKQLLTFARKTESVFEPLDVNIIIKELAKMLHETFPRSITIVPQLDPSIPSITADATQIHQVLLNLCVNARDAMPKGGTLTLTSRCVPLDQLSKRFPQATARQYVELTVSDTGIGMDKQTLSRIFEPFFTTKGVGQGTGLGLAVVHGVLGAHNGFIDVESQPGKGSTFRLYLPATEKSLFAEVSTPASATELPTGTETILIVEDEEYLRQALENYLSTSGYTVLSAANGKEALEIYRARMNDIHLVISDIGLPQMSGDELLRQIKNINSAARVILASGFIDPNVKSDLLKSGVSDIMTKPYMLKDVLLKTRNVLDM